VTATIKSADTPTCSKNLIYTVSMAAFDVRTDAKYGLLYR